MLMWMCAHMHREAHTSVYTCTQRQGQLTVSSSATPCLSSGMFTEPESHLLVWAVWPQAPEISSLLLLGAGATDVGFHSWLWCACWASELIINWAVSQLQVICWSLHTQSWELCHKPLLLFICASHRHLGFGVSFLFCFIFGFYKRCGNEYLYTTIFTQLMKA